MEIKNMNENKNESLNESKNKKNKKLLIISSAAVLLIAAIVLLCVFLSGAFHSETYDFVYDAIKKTESLDTFMAEVSSNTTVTRQGASLYTSTAGYILADKESDMMSVYINTVSNTPDDPDSDYDVTVSMYSDGENVYDNSTGTDQKVDMTCDEFDEIVDGFGLYKYDESKAEKASFNEVEIEEYENCGEMTITLSDPGDDVLKSYAATISEVTGENVTKDDLITKTATVVYSIYDDLVQSQICNFTVEYETPDGQKVKYTVSNTVSYVETFDEEDDVEYTEYIDIEETKEE